MRDEEGWEDGKDKIDDPEGDRAGEGEKDNYKLGGEEVEGSMEGGDEGLFD